MVFLSFWLKLSSYAFSGLVFRCFVIYGLRVLVLAFAVGHDLPFVGLG